MSYQLRYSSNLPKYGGEMTLKPVIQTKLGKAYNAKIEEFLASPEGKKLDGKVQLVFTSPPYPMVSPKKYGNKVGDEYLNWLAEISLGLSKLLTPNGSLVIEIGNAWNKGEPTMSTLPLESLMAIGKRTELNICQQFIWHNPGKLPGPATWVNIKRERITDSFTHIWWYSPSSRPKANNRNVLQPYKAAMEKLIKRQKFNHGVRPSGHTISETGFLQHNGGSIPPSAIIMANTGFDTEYRDWCKSKGIPQHPARMPIGLADFFIKFLTDEKDLVLDPFGGSCTTGKSAENLKRKWVCVEAEKDYLRGAKGRFKVTT